MQPLGFIFLRAPSFSYTLSLALERERESRQFFKWRVLRQKPPLTILSVRFNRSKAPTSWMLSSDRMAYIFDAAVATIILVKLKKTAILLWVISLGKLSRLDFPLRFIFFFFFCRRYIRFSFISCILVSREMTKRPNKDCTFPTKINTHHITRVYFFFSKHPPIHRL